MSDLLDDGQKKSLLAMAREAITAKLADRKAVKAATEDTLLRGKRGAFVTLNIHGRLRGCIGYPLPVKPLAETVAEMAVAAATQDYRFPPVEASELRDLTIEISVLTLPRRVRDPHDIVVGKHGIIISKGTRRGLLLPQVPLEYGWDLETYLRHGCLKAGLPDNEWKKGVEIEVFEAQVFGEES